MCRFRLCRIISIVILMVGMSVGLMNGQGYAAPTTVDVTNCTGSTGLITFAGDDHFTAIGDPDIACDNFAGFWGAYINDFTTYDGSLTFAIGGGKVFDLNKLVLVTTNANEKLHLSIVGFKADDSETVPVSYVTDTSLTETVDFTTMNAIKKFKVSVLGESGDDLAVVLSILNFTYDNAHIPNHAPTDMELNNTTVNQSAGANALVGTFTTTDADSGDTFTYALTTGAGDADNGKFSIGGMDGNQLFAKDASIAAGNYSVRIQTKDSAGDLYSESFTIKVVDDIAPDYRNSTPALSGILADQATMTVQLDEAGKAYYVVVANGAALPSAAQVKAGHDSTDSAALKSGTITVSSAGVDAAGTISGLQAHTDYDVYVVAEDSVPNLQANAMKLDLQTINSIPIPTGLTVAMNENTANGTLVGTVTATDADGDTLTYSITAGNSSGAFAIDSSTGKVTVADSTQLDYEAIHSFVLTVQVSDGINTADTTATINLANLDGNALLASLQVSDGVLAPIFKPTVDQYKVNVGYDVDDITVTASTYSPLATMIIHGKIAINAVPTDSIHLNVGDNDIEVVVTAQDGATSETYTLTVDRKAKREHRSSGYGSGYQEQNKQIRTVDIIVGNEKPPAFISQIEITQTIDEKGRKIDHVEIGKEKTLEVVTAATQNNKHVIRVVIDDQPNDPADKVAVNLSPDSIELLSKNKITLEIQTDHGMIIVPADSIQAFAKKNKILSFTVAPLRNQNQQQVSDSILHKIRIWGTPIEIEAKDYKGSTAFIFPFNSISIPDHPMERVRFLNSLAIYVEHSDGQKVLQFGEVQYDEQGEPTGIAIQVNQFSAFTLLSIDGLEKHSAYMSGYPDGKFEPNKPITRAEMASVLAKLLGGNFSETATLPQDVISSHWAAAAIEKVMASGLMIGDADGKFRPDSPVTRAEMAVLITKWKQLLSAQGQASFDQKQPLAQTSKTFLDIQAHWAKAYIEAAANKGVLQGYPDGTFRPNRVLSRAEAVTVLNQLLGRQPSAGEGLHTWSDVPQASWAYPQIEEASTNHRFIVQKDGTENVIPDLSSDFIK